MCADDDEYVDLLLTVENGQVVSCARRGERKQAKPTHDIDPACHEALQLAVQAREHGELFEMTVRRAKDFADLDVRGSPVADIVERIRFLASGQDDVHSVELDNAANEIEKLRMIICAALDCLGHDDPERARKILEG